MKILAALIAFCAGWILAIQFARTGDNDLKTKTEQKVINKIISCSAQKPTDECLSELIQVK